MRPSALGAALLFCLGAAWGARAAQVNHGAANFRAYNAGEQSKMHYSANEVGFCTPYGGSAVASIERDGTTSGAVVYVDGNQFNDNTAYLTLVAYSPDGVFLGATSASIVTTGPPPTPYYQWWERLLVLTPAQAPAGAYLALIATLPRCEHYYSLLYGYTVL